MERNNKRRAIELGKDVLILLLTCSALWLASRTQLAGALSSLFRGEGPQTVSSQGQGGGRTEAVLPMAMVVNLPGAGLPVDGDGVRYGLQHDQGACQELFQRLAGLLVEALSSVGQPEQIDRDQWEEVLTESLSVMMDFRGKFPMPVLVGWLSGGQTELNAVVRRLVLAAEGDALSLYYRDEADGKYYRTRCEMTDAAALAEGLSGLTGNGFFYAFESDLYETLDPDTLLSADVSDPAVYTVSNPMSGGQPALEALVQDLGFSLNSTTFYSTDEQVARSGDDNVRLSDRGVAFYQAGGEESGRFPVLSQRSSGALYDSVEACRQLAVSTLGGRCGEARLYLRSADETDRGWEISFGYSLNGIPVQTEEGYAARFLVENGQITQFTLHFRSYAPAGTTAPVLPSRQAAAALGAMGLEGEELVLIYSDTGGDTLSAGWSARANRDRED